MNILITIQKKIKIKITTSKIDFHFRHLQPPRLRFLRLLP